ncbi:MAG TPA: sigma-54 dependent transcriptional regulator [Flavilitoribacter sp.]|nr:sigma-54 dependent transcriptional regulator [Flavilitoribacter sp.]HMQ87363.1 sigma-54 dependent transcriptional regulator [Flavilitoribacter sp.]
MILIIDDEQAVLASLRLLFLQNGLESAGAKTPQTAMDHIRANRPDLVLLDMNFSVDTSGREGLALLRRILEYDPGIPVILITGWSTLQLAVEGMKTGARDFISKPWDNEHLLNSVRTILSLSDAGTLSPSRKKLDEAYHFEHIIGEDPEFLKVLETVGRVAPTDASVLILGESGTGKELIAEAIHQNSSRRQNPFVKVNLGGISGSLFESELFGHKKGAFTDARHDRKGRFELSDTGTIFLDEIGELELSSQVKLLRVLQDRSFEMLGSSFSRRVDVRVISATNRDLSEEVAAGNFREDLFYRINLITVRVPSLRERPADIPKLADFYVQNLKRLYRRPGVHLSKSATAWLQHYPFPGNVRQLKNLVERTVLLTQKDQLQAEDFRDHLDPAGSKVHKAAFPEVGSISLEDMEKEMIVKAMDFHGNNIGKVAVALGITRSSLYRRLDKYRIPHD